MTDNIENMEAGAGVSFTYSVDQEAKRVKGTIAKFPWFKENGYPLERFTLPHGLDLNKILANEEDISDDKIHELVSEEFSEGVYQEITETLLLEWPNVAEELKKLLENCSLSIQPGYKITLTRYGTGGSYNLPNLVYLNIRFQNGDTHRVFVTLIHEVIHLSIQELINKYNIAQWQKERLVDLMLATFFPEMKRMQKNILEKTELDKIDKIFNSGYPNIEEIIKKVGELNI